MDPEDIFKSFIKLITNCDIDQRNNPRIEIMNNFKVLIKNFGKEKFREYPQIYDEEIIFGKN